MNIDFQWNLQQVVDGIPRGVLAERAKRSFFYPHDNIWPTDEGRFLSMADEIHENLNPDQQKIFLSGCLASYLLNPSKAPQCFSEWFLTKTTVCDLLGLELSWDEITSWDWGRAAIPGVDLIEGWNDKVIYALVGSSRKASSLLQVPAWAHSFLNKEAREAIQTAAELLAYRPSARGFLFWPMLDPASSTCSIKGGSLGLPVYLSFFSLRANTPVPAILASGALDKDGKLLEVGGLEEKLRLAHKKGFTAFVYPLFDGVKPLDSTGKVEPQGVQNLEQAECIWNGNHESICQFKTSTQVPLEDVMSEVQGIGDKLVDPLKEINSTTTEIKNVLNHYKLLAVTGIVFIVALMLFLANANIFHTTINGGKDAASNGRGEEALKLTSSEGLKAGTQHGESVPPSARRVKGPENTGDSKRSKEVPIPIPSSVNQTQAVAKVFEDLNVAIDNRLLNENADNATTSSCFRVAKEMMVNGKFITARKKYEECFKQNNSYLDTLLDYQKVLKGMEGYEGARTSFRGIQQEQSNTTVIFAGLLFDTPKKRYSQIKNFIETTPGYTPAYYWLGMDCYEYFGKDSGCSEILSKFINSTQIGTADKYFLNRQQLKNMISEAQEKIGAR